MLAGEGETALSDLSQDTFVPGDGDTSLRIGDFCLVTGEPFLGAGEIALGEATLCVTGEPALGVGETDLRPAGDPDLGDPRVLVT